RPRRDDSRAPVRRGDPGGRPDHPARPGSAWQPEFSSGFEDPATNEKRTAEDRRDCYWHCKRLAEGDFPIAVVSGHSERDKSIQRWHPSTLHPWWRARPWRHGSGSLPLISTLLCHLDRSGEISRRQAILPVTG